MNTSLLLDWIRDPKLLDRDSLLQLRSIINTYPCFAPARVLYLKNLDFQNDFRFSIELNRTAISVPDRKRLFYFMEDKLPVESLKETDLKVDDEKGISIIDHYLNNAEAISFITKDNQDNSVIPDSKLIAKSNKEKQNVSDGFTLDYLSYLSIYTNNDVSATSTLYNTVPMKGQELIDAYLSNPQIENINSDSQEKDERQITTSDEKSDISYFIDIPEASFTETLARIYLKQKRYDRALEIIKSLSLKYPEKNVYFADQIRYLEKLIINTKKR